MASAAPDTGRQVSANVRRHTTLLSLDNPEWSKLGHAYGAASDIPALLVELASFPDATTSSAEPYFSLWSALCHQDDTCTAAYAAVPHIVALASSEPQRLNYQFLLLPTAIEIARLKGRGPEVPKSLEFEYLRAIQQLPAIIPKLNQSRMDETMTLTCAAAIAVASGYPLIADAILELEGESAGAFLEWKANL